MAPIAITPETSRTTTPVTIEDPLRPETTHKVTKDSISALTISGIKHSLPTTNGSSNGSNGVHDSGLAPLDASRITVQLTTTPRAVPLPGSKEVAAQKTCTDHMITARWTVEQGWEAPELKPYGAFSIMPSASVLHYATECFEGLKLYRGYDGKLRLFRVARNCERMRRSAARIALPDFDAEELRKLIVALCAKDGRKWLPKERAGGFLYLRPTFIATDEALGVQRPKEALLYVILACFPDMTKSLSATPSAPPALTGAATPKPSAGLKLLASSEDSIRAWPGGFGYAKVGANYGPSLVAQGEARSRGFDQVLWLFGKEGWVTEAGASNFFVVWKNAQTGRKELVTAPLERIILEGVTRASVIDLARERLGDELDVVEERFTMSAIVAAHDEGRLVEAFAAGTAFFIAAVGGIHFRGRDLVVPTEGSFGDGGSYTGVIRGWLSDIMYGNVEHEWGVVVDEVA